MNKHSKKCNGIYWQKLHYGTEKALTYAECAHKSWNISYRNIFQRVWILDRIDYLHSKAFRKEDWVDHCSVVSTPTLFSWHLLSSAQLCSTRCTTSPMLRPQWGWCRGIWSRGSTGREGAGPKATPRGSPPQGGELSSALINVSSFVTSLEFSIDNIIQLQSNQYDTTLVLIVSAQTASERCRTLFDLMMMKSNGDQMELHIVDCGFPRGRDVCQR